MMSVEMAHAVLGEHGVKMFPVDAVARWLAEISKYISKFNKTCTCSISEINEENVIKS